MPRLGHPLLPASLLAYTLATCWHFAHNGVYLADYPNMPGWLGRAAVALGLGGVLVLRRPVLD